MTENLDNPTFDAAERGSQRAYEEMTLADQRRDETLYVFVARTAFLIRAARQEPEKFSERVKELKLSRKTRPELKCIRVAAGKPKLGEGETHWANAAAYVAEPPNGDPPPQTVNSASDYIERRGGVKNLSKLWVHRNDQAEAEHDIAAEIDALLEDIEPDFYAEQPAERYLGAPGFDGKGYALALLNLSSGEGYVLYGKDSQLISHGKRVRKRGILEEGVTAYVERMRRQQTAQKFDRDEDSEGDEEDAETDVSDPIGLAASPPLLSIKDSHDGSELRPCHSSPWPLDGIWRKLENRPFSFNGARCVPYRGTIEIDVARMEAALPIAINQDRSSARVEIPHWPQREAMARSGRKLVCVLAGKIGCQSHRLCHKEGRCREAA